jgi:uncharacterized protein (TIGR02147 family)
VHEPLALENPLRQRVAALCLRMCFTMRQRHVKPPFVRSENTFYISKLKEDLSLKQRQNPHYSLRAYARDLGLHSSTLSQVLKGKRPLPIRQSVEIVKRLALGPKERTLFLESLYQSKASIDEIQIPEADDRFLLDESHFKAIAEWEHYAVVTLFDVDGFEAGVEDISRRLGITGMRAEVVLQNLLTCGLIRRDENGNLVKAHPRLRTTEDVSSVALKESHKETLEMGKKKLDEVEVELRDFSSMTIALDVGRLPEAKTIIREFRQKLSALLKDGKKTDVYQLAIQFYPLTQKQQSQENV